MADVMQAPQTAPEAAPRTGVEQALRQLMDSTNASTIFGQPVSKGDTTVIPCGEFAVGMGLGSGSGYGPDAAGKGQTGGVGAGGGGGARGRPVAAIVITPSGVRVEPVLDLTRIALAGMVTGGFALAWLFRLVRATNVRSARGPSLGQLRKIVE